MKPTSFLGFKVAKDIEKDAAQTQAFEEEKYNIIPLEVPDSREPVAQLQEATLSPLMT